MIVPLQPRRRWLAGVAFVLACGLASSAPAANVQVAVDANQYVRPLEARHFALNAAIWDHALGSDATVAMFQELGVKSLRFPGGSLSDAYHWQTNMTQDQGWNGPWFSDYLEFSKLAKATNARVMITVNYGTGTPDEAAAWVEDANNTNHLGFKYWEVGNECYGSWELDKQSAPHDAVLYATRFADYYAKMKAKDPTVRIGAVVAARESYYTMTPLDDCYRGSHTVVNARTNVSHKGWTPVMLSTLKSLGVTPDFVIFHRYVLTPGKETDADLLNSSATWVNDASEIRQELSDYLGAAGANVELVTTENNSVSYGAGKQTTSLVTGLFCADSFGSMIQTEFNGNYWWEFYNGVDATGNLSSSLYGWRQYGTDAIVAPVNNVDQRLPAFYTTKLISRFARPGDLVVRATSGNALLSCYAVRRTDGSLGLLVVNKSATDALTADFTLAAFAPGASATTYSYGIPQDNAARDGTGGTDLAEGTLALSGPVFSATFGAYSATVIVLPPSVAASYSPKLIALSSRGYVGAAGVANNPLVVGFSSSGAQSVVLRGVGPTLGSDPFKLPGVLADPTLTVFDGQSLEVARNDNWGGDQTLAALFNRLGEFALPASSLDAALLYSAASGTSTAQIDTKTGTAGVAIAEIYAADSTQPARLLGLSARGIVGTGSNVLVGGFVITGSAPTKVLIRGVGPTLAQNPFNIANALQDPVLQLFDAEGRLICANDDWAGDPALAAAFKATYEFALDPLSLDAAILITLPPGLYTAQLSPGGGQARVSDAGSPSGVGIIEIYQVP